MPVHEHQQIRLTPRARHLRVLHSERVTPHMQRIVVGGDDMEGFESPSPDDHVKLFFPNADGAFVLPEFTTQGPRYADGALPSPARDYTPRAFDMQANELLLDFVLHGDGVASTWAQHAQVGDTLVVAGPRGSHVVADDFDNYILLGDETALPAIARRLEELPDGAYAEAYVEIPEEADRQEIFAESEAQVSWLERNGVDAASSTLLEEVLRDFEAPEGDTFYWIAAESKRARALRQFLETHLNVPKEWIRATGYWKADADQSP